MRSPITDATEHLPSAHLNLAPCAARTGETWHQEAAPARRLSVQGAGAGGLPSFLGGTGPIAPGGQPCTAAHRAGLD